MAVENHQQVLLMGDLNFRINAYSRKEVIEKINDSKLDDLIKEDDLIVAFDKFNAVNRKQIMDNRYMDMFFRNF